MHYELWAVKILACVSNLILNASLSVLERRERRIRAKLQAKEKFLHQLTGLSLKQAHEALTESYHYNEKMTAELCHINSLSNSIQNLQDDFADILEAA